MVYCKTHLENYIESLYRKLGIHSPDQLNHIEISKQLNIKVKDHPDSRTCLRIGSISYILLNNQLNEQQKWQEFAHEATVLFWWMIFFCSTWQRTGPGVWK